MTYRTTFTCPDGAKARIRTVLKLMGAENIRITEEQQQPQQPKPKSDNLPTSPEAKACADLYGRSHDKEWSEAEKTEFIKARKRGVLTLESMKIIATHYKSERKKEQHYCRRDLLTFLRNYSGEIDRATAAKPRGSKALEWSDSTPKLTVLPDPAEEERVRANAKIEAERFREQQRMAQ